MNKRTKIFFKIFFYTPLFLLIIGLILVTLFISIGRNLVRSYEIKKETSLLKEEVQKLEGRNKELSYLINFFNTNSFAEEQARLKLGLGKPGESAIVVQGEETRNPSAAAAPAETAINSNPKKWWNYFFNY